MFTSIRVNIDNNKKAMLAHYIKLLITLFLISNACFAFDPEINVKINLPSQRNASHHHQLAYCSAVSERYLHHQLLQQLCFAEPNLTTYSVDQLAQYFAQQGYSEEQILQRHDLYKNPTFIKLVKTYAGYQRHITSLNKQLQQKSGFAKWIGTFTGTHIKGLTKRITQLHKELEQEKIERERSQQAARNNMAKETYRKKVQQPLLQSDAMSDWYELSAVYQEYDCGEGAPLQRRCDALEEIQSCDAIYSDCSHVLSEDVTQILRFCGYDLAHYKNVFGNQFQHVLHQECIELLERTAKIPIKSAIYNHKEALVDCIDSAREYNQEGFVHKASIIADFCWALLDYGSAVLEGVALGALGAVQDLVAHPIQTAACVVVGEYVLAYQLCKVLCNIADIGITALQNPSKAKKKWNDYIEPVNNIISSIKNREVSCRDAIKAGTALSVGFVAQCKLLGGLHKLYGGIKAQAITFAQNNLSLMPQQYTQTAEGLLLRATHASAHIGTSSKGVSQTSGFRQGAKKLLPKQPGMKGLIKKHQLPTKGRIRYVPPKNCHVSEDLPRVVLPGKISGYRDKFGNIWVKGNSRTAGEPFEWDVQLSEQGKKQLGWMTRDNTHLNVSLNGRVTHK